MVQVMAWTCKKTGSWVFVLHLTTYWSRNKDVLLIHYHCKTNQLYVNMWAYVLHCDFQMQKPTTQPLTSWDYIHIDYISVFFHVQYCLLTNSDLSQHPNLKIYNPLSKTSTKFEVQCSRTLYLRTFLLMRTLTLLKTSLLHQRWPILLPTILFLLDP